MKKNKIIIVIVALVALAAFLKLTFFKSVNNEEKTVSSDDIKNSLPNVPQTIKPLNQKEDKANKVKKVYEVKEDKFDVFDRIEKEWLSQVSVLLGEKNYTLYLDMRDRNEKEKLQAYQAFHDYLRSKYGENFKYNISEDQSVNEKRINDKYQKELLKLIGEEKYKTYLKTLDQFNEKTRRESNGKNFVLMEF